MENCNVNHGQKQVKFIPSKVFEKKGYSLEDAQREIDEFVEIFGLEMVKKVEPEILCMQTIGGIEARKRIKTQEFLLENLNPFILKAKQKYIDQKFPASMNVLLESATVLLKEDSAAHRQAILDKKEDDERIQKTLQFNDTVLAKTNGVTVEIVQNKINDFINLYGKDYVLSFTKEMIHHEALLQTNSIEDTYEFLYESLKPFHVQAKKITMEKRHILDSERLMLLAQELLKSDEKALHEAKTLKIDHDTKILEKLKVEKELKIQEEINKKLEEEALKKAKLDRQQELILRSQGLKVFIFSQEKKELSNDDYIFLKHLVDEKEGLSPIDLDYIWVQNELCTYEQNIFRNALNDRAVMSKYFNFLRENFYINYEKTMRGFQENNVFFQRSLIKLFTQENKDFNFKIFDIELMDSNSIKTKYFNEAKEELLSIMACSECHPMYKGIMIYENDGVIKLKECDCNSRKLFYEGLIDFKILDSRTIENAMKIMESAFIPAAYAPCTDIQDIERVKKIASRVLKKESLFMHGDNTHFACSVLFYCALQGKTVGFLKESDLVMYQKDLSTTSFRTDSEEYLTNQINKFMAYARHYDVLVLDKIGSFSLKKEHEKTRQIIENRLEANKPTLCLSDCVDDAKKLAKQIGGDTAKIFEKMAVVKVDFGLKNKVENQSEVLFCDEDDIPPEKLMTLEQQKSVNMSLLSPKLMTLKEEEVHIMNWIARSPIFEVVDTRRRHQLTRLNSKGIEEDAEREVSDFYDGVWGKNSELQVRGTVCDREDGMLYSGLLKMYTERHRCGERGLTLKTTYREILRFTDIAWGGDQLAHVKRRLDRLNRINIRYRNKEQDRKWQGALIMSIFEDIKNDAIYLTFNPYLVAFYEAHQYTIVNKDIYWSLNGFAASLLTFYSSHKENDRSFPRETIKKVVGIPDKLSLKEQNRRLKTGIDQLINVGFLDPKSRIDGDTVHTFRISKK